MEHLPQPIQPHKGIRCRYVPNTYESAPKAANEAANEFFDFDRLTDIFTKVLEAEDENGLTSQHHLEGLFQAWLYFGLLREVFGHSTDIRDHYICRDWGDGHEYLSTTHLKDSVEMWHTQYNDAGDSKKEGMRSHTVSSIRAANYVLNGIMHPPDPYIAPTRIISCEFEVVVRVLIQSLEFELLPDELPRQRVMDDTHEDTHICRMLTQRLLDYRWCPNQVSMLAYTLDVPSLYYATLLGPDMSGKAHRACTDKLCKANQIDQTKYQTAHVSESCRCDFAGPAFNDLAAIVQDETVPLIEVMSRGEGVAPNIRVHKFEDGMKYVAISHVWADGLGNPQANTLPICQLNWLSEHVKGVIPGSVLFWCDTLCVPTSPRELRKKAIWKMRDVYQQAYAVLVIDASFKTATISCSAEELMMRITCSGWMRRLWTYQENVLAKKLRALLSDGIANIDQAERGTRTHQLGNPIINAASYNTSVGLEASVFYRKSLNGPDLRRGVSIGSVWESVQWRMTSYATDEPICLATALAIDLPAILTTPEDQRMKQLFSQLSGWPPYMIFATYDRMSEPGWKWAPTTLMGPRSMAAPKMHHMNATTRWHEEGLIVQFPGFVIDIDHFRRSLKNTGATTAIDLSNSFYLKDRETGTWYSCHRDDDQEIVSYDLAELCIQGLANPAIILSCPVETLSPQEKPPPQLWDGLLVDVKRSVNDTVFTDYVVKILVGQVPRTMVADIEEEFSDPQLVEAYSTPLMTALCDIRDCQQKWCVG